MQIAFDPTKDAVTLAKHGVSLAFGAKVWNDPLHVLLPTTRVEDGEQRFKAIGLIADRLWTAVHTPRGTAVRMISVGRSNDGEQRAYHRDPR